MATKAVADTNLTDAEKHVLEAIVVTLNIMADENELSGRVQDVPHPLLVSSWKYAGCEMRSYLNRLRKWLQTGTETFIMACALMKRLDQQGLLPAFTQHSIHQVFFICVVICIKCHEDVTLSNPGFAKVGGVSVEDLNAMERYVVFSLKWKLQNPQSEYVAMHSNIMLVADFLGGSRSGTTLSVMVPITFCGICDFVRPALPVSCDDAMVDDDDDADELCPSSLKSRISKKITSQKSRMQSLRSFMTVNKQYPVVATHPQTFTLMSNDAC